MINLQVIFQSQNGDNGTWLDYCREPAPHGMDKAAAEAWAQGWCNTLSKRYQRERGEAYAFRFRIEDWT